ncbi:hypothetical protein Bca4012_026380 [Brassica carinata]
MKYCANSGFHGSVIVQLIVPPSLFGMDTTARGNQHVQEVYSGTKNQLGYLQVPGRTCRTSLCRRSRYNPEITQEATATTSKPQGTSSLLNATRRPAR